MGVKDVLTNLNLSRVHESVNEAKKDTREKAKKLIDMVADGKNYKPGDSFSNQDWKVEVTDDVIKAEFKPGGVVLEYRTDSDEVKVFDKSKDEFINADKFVEEVFKNMPKNESVNQNKTEGGLTDDMVSVEKIIKALACKRGDEYVEQIEDLEVISKQDTGVVLQISMMNDDSLEVVGDFLTTAELEKVEVNVDESNEGENLKETLTEEEEAELTEIVKNNSFMNLRDSLKDAGYVVDYVNSPIPLYTIEKNGKTIHITNKKYVEEADLVVDDIAIGESIENKDELDSILEDRVDRMFRFLDFMGDEDLLEEIVRALSERDAQEIFDYVLRMWGDNWALDIRQELDNMRRMEILNTLLSGGVPAENILEDIVRAMDKRQAEEVFDYISRMHDIPENDESEDKVNKIIEQIKKKHNDKEEVKDSVVTEIEFDVEDFTAALENEGFSANENNIKKVVESILDNVAKKYEDNKDETISEVIEELSSQLED